MQALNRINDFAAAAVKALVVAMVLVMLCVLSAQVLLRYAFDFALSWSEELSLGLFTWTVLLTSALGVREGFHVRMALLLDLVPTARRRLAERAIHLATAVFGAYLTWAGIQYFSETRGMTSAAIGYPIEFLYAAAPACGALILLFALEHAIKGTIPEGMGADSSV
jgi:TRAP-type C4-dicarboxylate transport system permease small subunit